MRIILMAAMLAVAGISCTPSNSESTTTTTPAMNNLVSIIEIPAADLPRAIKFYGAILGMTLEEAEMGGVKMGIFPADPGAVNVVLASSADYTPSATASIIYLNAGDKLQSILDLVERHGGQVLVPKTEISPEMGYFALFMDTEGNRVGLAGR